MALTFEGVKRYLVAREEPSRASSDPLERGVGELPLDELREEMQAESDAGAGTLELVKAKREREKVEELRQVKIKHQRLRAQKRKETIELQRTLRELEQRKKRELELRLEKEKLKQGIEKVDRTNLDKVESEKRRELDALTKEREALQAKEEEIMAEVDELEKKILEQEEVAQGRKRQVEKALQGKSLSKSEQKTAQLVQLAQLHGARTSTLAQQRSKLEEERKTLEETLARLRGSQHGAEEEVGPDANGGHQEEMTKLVDTVEERIAEQQERIAQMRLEQAHAEQEISAQRITDETETKLLQPPGINKSLPFAVEVDSFLQEWLAQDARGGAALGAAQEQLDTMAAEAVEPPRPRGALARSPAFSVRGASPGGGDEEGAPSAAKGGKGSKHTRGGLARNPALEQTVVRMKREYMRMGVDNPAMWKEIQGLESQLYSNYAPQPAPVFLSSPRNPVGSPIAPGSAAGPAAAQQYILASPTMAQLAHSPASPAHTVFAGSNQGSPMVDYQLTRQQKLLDKQTRAIKRLASAQKATKGSAARAGRRRSSRGRPERDSDSDSSATSSSTASSDSSSSVSSSTGSSYSRRRGAGRRRSRRRPRPSRYRHDLGPVGGPPIGEDASEVQRQAQLFNKAIEGLTTKLRALSVGVGVGGVGPAGAAAGAGAGAGAMALAVGGEKNRFLEELSTLEMIPRDSELYDMQVEHLKMLRKMHFEIDALKQKQSVSSIREDIERKQRAQAKQAEFEELKLEQKRQLELARGRKAIARESAELHWNGNSGEHSARSGSHGYRRYDPNDGFVLYLDYVMGIPKRFEMVRLVFCIYDGEDVKTPAKALPVCETEMETATKSTALLVARKRFQKIAALDSLRVVFELQNVQVDANGSKGYQSIGWTVLELFRGRPGQMHLDEGALVLVIQRPPFKPSDLTSFGKDGSNKAAEGSAAMRLYLRLVHPDDTERAGTFVVDPNVTQHMYHDQAEVRGGGKQAKKGGKRKQNDKSAATSFKRKPPAAKEAAALAEEAEGEEDGEGDKDETASITESIISSASAARSVATAVSEMRNTKANKHGVAIGVEYARFDDESPANPTFVRVTLLPKKSLYGRHEDDSKALLSIKAQGGSSGTFDYGALRDVLHVWQNSARDVRLSSGEAVWPPEEMASSTFFDGLELDKETLLLFKVFERGEADDSFSRPSTRAGGEGGDEDDEDDEAEHDGKLVGWAVRPVLHHKGGVSLPSGGVEDIELLQPPVRLPFDEDDSEWLNARIGVRFDGASGGNGAARKRKRRGSVGSVASRFSSIADGASQADGDGMSQGSGMSAVEEDERAWVEVRHPPPGKRAPKFERGDDGFDVYVDGCRFLPDYTTITSAHVKLLSPSYDMIGEEAVGFPRLSDPAQAPAFRLRAEFRGEEVANPAGVLLFRVDTVDRHSRKSYAIGYTCLNAFCKSDGSGEPASRTAQKDFTLNAGAFQLPLFQDQPDKQLEFAGDHFVKRESKRVPCATLLVRIVPAKKSKDGVHILELHAFPPEQWEKRGLVLPAPKYGPQKSGRSGSKRAALDAYDSSRCVPLACEEELYRNVADREEALVGEMVPFAKRLNMEEDKNVDTLEDEELIEWIKKRLERPHGMMPVDALAQYNPESGFKVGILRILHVPPKGAFYKVVYSLSPPGAYYHEPKITDEVGFTLYHNWRAPLAAPAFADDLHCFKDVPFNSKLVLVLEVQRITIHKKKGLASAPAGWAVVPVFRRANGAFCDNGVHQAPLLEGAPSRAFLDQLQASSEDPEAFLLAQTSGKPSKKSLARLDRSYASVLVKIVDAQLEDCLTLEAGKPLTRLVPPKLAPKYSFNEAKLADLPEKSKKSLESQLGKGQTQAEMETALNEHFAKVTEIQNYTF